MPGIREINIAPCLNGFVCYIGCQVAVFSDAETMAAKLVEYCNNPDEVEKEWLGSTKRYMGSGITTAAEGSQRLQSDVPCGNQYQDTALEERG